MKFILKVFAVPLLLVTNCVWLIGKLVSNLSSYVIGLLLLVIAGCAIYSAIHAMWPSLAILAGMALIAFLLLFVLVWLEVKAEHISNVLRDFIHS